MRVSSPADQFMLALQLLLGFQFEGMVQAVGGVLSREGCGEREYCQTENKGRYFHRR